MSNTDAYRTLTEHGLPASTILFEATSAPGEGAIDVDGRHWIRIGTFDEDLGFYLDCELGEIRFGGDGNSTLTLVNRDLDRFMASILVVDRLFPFYRYEDSAEVKFNAGSELERLLAEVDDVVLTEVGSFWRSIIHDVAIGDYYEGSV